MMRTTASSSNNYHNQEMLEDLFDEINGFLGNEIHGSTPVPMEQYPARSSPSNKTAVEPMNESMVDQSQPFDYDSQPILVESEESEDDMDYNNDSNAYQHQYHSQNLATTNTTSQQIITPLQQQQCLLLCPITEESPSVCMCYSCKKKKSEDLYLSTYPSSNKKSPQRLPKQKRSWAALGGFADRVKQTFAYSNNNNSRSSLLSPSSIKSKRQSHNYGDYPSREDAYDDNDNDDNYLRPPSTSQKRLSSRDGGRKRWIPRPKSLPAIAAFIQKRPEYVDDEQVIDYDDYDEDFDQSGYGGSRIEQDRPRSWYSKKSNKSRRSSRRSSIYNDINDNDDDAYNYYGDNNSNYDNNHSSMAESRNDDYYDNGIHVAAAVDQKQKRSSVYDGISQKYEMLAGSKIEPMQQQQQNLDYFYHREIQPQQPLQMQEQGQPYPLQQQPMYDTYDSDGNYQDQANQQYQTPSIPLEQPFTDQQNVQYFSDQQPQQFLSEPLQASPMTATPTSLPGLAELPFLTPGTRIGEKHEAEKWRGIRTLDSKEQRMAAYNNAYYHCIMAKSNLIPWLTKQYSKGPPDAMFDYTPKPKKMQRKLLGMFKLCNTGNNKDGTSPKNGSSGTNHLNNSSFINVSQMPWQPSVSPSASGYLMSSPTSASPNAASILSSTSVNQNHLPQPQLHAPNTWPSNNSHFSLLSPVSQQHLVGGSETSMSPSSTLTPISSVDEANDLNIYGGKRISNEGREKDIISNSSGIYQCQQEEEEIKDEEEPFEPVLPRPRSFCSSSNISIHDLKRRPSRSSGISLASTSKSDIYQQQKPVSILKKTRSSASLQPQPNRFYSDNEEDYDDNDYYDDYPRPSSSRSSKKFLEAPISSSSQQRRQQQQHNKGHAKRRSFSQVEEPIYYMDRRRRPLRQPFPRAPPFPRRSSSRGSFYDDPEDEEIYDEPYHSHHPDDMDEEVEYMMEDDRPLPRRILSRARAHQGFYHGSRLNHLRSSRGPPPLWVAENEPVEYVDDVVIEEDPPFPRRIRRTSGRRLSRPSSRNSMVVYDDVVPVPAPRASPVYYY
ncbi:hypothetical protein BDA99DRAFT_493488 [Phascolomyces articulosus]|uniref:Uncharacterized protein n=1 Tax=Phascolomyces articulosus TaxID=60185 RepID=A0AAD5KCS9_9FUNG|nr:hypothetical protein BDA99DRAFT_493488 [Phascolomyces articulosus]